MPAAGWGLHYLGWISWICTVGMVRLNNGAQAALMPDCLDLCGGQHG